MVKCECGNTISDEVIIKGLTVIQISKDKKEFNVRCKKCKRWITKLSFNELFGEISTN